MEFKPGMKVRISERCFKSLGGDPGWYGNRGEETGHVPYGMDLYVGKVVTLQNQLAASPPWWKIKEDDDDYSWDERWFDSVVPIEFDKGLLDRFY